MINDKNERVVFTPKVNTIEAITISPRSVVAKMGQLDEKQQQRILELIGSDVTIISQELADYLGIDDLTVSYVFRKE